MTCNIPIDFGIIVDTSGSISRRNFKVLLRFIRSLVDGFQVSEDQTHIAIVEYSTKASVQLRFNDLPGRRLNKDSVFGVVNRIPHTRGHTYIDRALLKANDEVFTLKAGMRADVRKVKRFPCDIKEMSRNGILGLYNETVKQLDYELEIFYRVIVDKGATRVACKQAHIGAQVLAA